VSTPTDDLDKPVAYDNSLKDFHGNVLDLISFQYRLMFFMLCSLSFFFNKEFVRNLFDN
jgi:hypothetical protein